MFARQFVSVIFVAMALLGSSGASASTCNKVEVTVTPFSATVNSTLSAREMLDKMLAGGAYNTSDEAMALGMVVAQEEHKINVVREEANCRVFQISVGFSPATVYIAHEVVENQCGYRHIRNHEFEHVGIYQDFLVDVGIRLTKALSEIVAADAEVDTYLAGQLMYKAIGNEFSTVYRKQHSLDSNETYLRNEKVCRGALMAIAKGV
jgi:hypothetical protein